VLCILVLAHDVLIAPSARHRVVGQGEATAGIVRPQICSCVFVSAIIASRAPGKKAHKTEKLAEDTSRLN
jgi:hypothetical protein